MRTEFTLTRRDLLLSLPVLAVARNVFAQAAGSTLRVRGLSQMTLSVSDVPRSLDFYQRVFGMPIQARQGRGPQRGTRAGVEGRGPQRGTRAGVESRVEGSTLILRIGAGPQYIALTPAGGNPPRISHLGMAVENFNADQVLKALADHGITKAEGMGGGLAGGPMKVRVRRRGPELGGAREGTLEIFFADHDGVVVQLQDVTYAGGAGRLGEVVKIEPPPAKGLLAVKDLSHFTISATDAPRSNALYKALFGTGVRSFQGPAAPTVAIGPSVEFVMFTGGGGAGRGGPTSATPSPPPRPASINHACLNMENFNVEAVQKALESVGIKPRAGTGPAGPMQHYISLRMENRGGVKEGTPELYFTDPDGLLIQLQDVSYCGGGGYLGNICPPVA